MAKTISVKMQVTADTKGVQQYNAAMKSAAVASKQAEGGVKELAGSFNDLNSMLNTAVFGMSAMAIVDLGVKMYQQGYAVNTASIAFRAYARAIGDADDMMKRLRAGTGNVITDFDLMTFSAELMGLNIARTDDQLVEMVSNVAKLAALKPGMSLAEGMEAFVRVMRNGATSFRMLDNIGISATRVKEIMKEMGQPLSNQVAYGQAVLQAIREKLDQIGDAAGRAYTPVNRTVTRIENLYNTLSSNVTQGIEGYLGILEAIDGYNPNQIAGREAAKPFYDEFTEQLGKITKYWDVIVEDIGIGADAIGMRIQQVYELWGTASLQERADLLSILENAYFDMENAPVFQQEQVHKALLLVMQAMENDESAAKYAENLKLISNEFDTIIEKAGKLHVQDVTASGYLGSLMTTIQPILDMTTIRNLPPELFTQSLSSMTVDMAMPNYMRQDQAEMAISLWEAAKRQLEDYKEAMKEDGTITEEMYSGLEIAVDNAKKLADEAKRAADNFKNMKLPDMFGQTGGGRMGEWLGNILDVMGSGATPYTKDIFAVASGQENKLSLLVRDTIDPFLANLAEIDPDMVVTIVANMEQALSNMSVLGFTVDQKAAALIAYWNGVVVPGATAVYGTNLDMGTGGNTFTITPGMTASEAAAAAGMSVEQLLQTYKFKDTKSVVAGTYNLPSMGGGIDALANIDPSLMMGLNQFAQSELPTAQPLADNLTTANTEAKPLQDVFATSEKHINNMVAKMQQLTSETQLVKIQFKVFGTEQWLEELLVTKKVIVNAEFASSGGDSGGFGTTGIKSDSKTPLVPIEE